MVTDEFTRCCASIADIASADGPPASPDVVVTMPHWRTPFVVHHESGIAQQRTQLGGSRRHGRLDPLDPPLQRVVDGDAEAHARRHG